MYVLDIIHTFSLLLLFIHKLSQVALISSWLPRSKFYLYLIGIYFRCTLCFLIVWSLSGFNGGCNGLYLLLFLAVVVVVSYILAPYAKYIFNKEIHPSISQGDELNREFSHLPSDLQRPENRQGISVAGVNGEPVSRDETVIIEPDNAFVPDRELSNDTAQTEDLFGLPEHLLTEIFKKLPAFHDFVSCSSVCKLWRSRWLNLKWSLYPPHPWSIHFQGQNIMNQLDDGRYVLERWEIDGRYYYGCVNGWILSIGSKHTSIFNPFSRTQRNLPMLSPVSYLPITKPSDWYSYIQKFILFKVGQGDYFQFLVVALFGPRDFIAFTRPSFQDWIYIQSVMAPFRDVVLFRNRFYALCGRGKLLTLAFERSKPRESLLSQEPAGSFRADRYYLVPNVDHLIAVFQNGKVDSGGKRFGTITLSTYKFDDTMNWSHIREPDYLEGRALFISSGNSWMIDPVTVENCRTNSIYFTDDYWFSNNRDGHFIGILDIPKGKIEDFQYEKDQYPPNDLTPFSLITMMELSKWRSSKRQFRKQP